MARRLRKTDFRSAAEKRAAKIIWAQKRGVVTRASRNRWAGYEGLVDTDKDRNKFGKFALIVLIALAVVGVIARINR